MKFFFKVIFPLAIIAAVLLLAFSLAPEEKKEEIKDKVAKVTGQASQISFDSLFDDTAHTQLLEMNKEFADVVKEQGASLWETLVNSGEYIKDGKITEEEARELSSKLINTIIASNPDLDLSEVSVPDLNSVLLDTFLSGE